MGIETCPLPIGSMTFASYLRSVCFCSLACKTENKTVVKQISWFLWRAQNSIMSIVSLCGKMEFNWINAWGGHACWGVSRVILYCFVGSWMWSLVSFFPLTLKFLRDIFPFQGTSLAQRQYNPETRSQWFCPLPRHLLCILSNFPSSFLEWAWPIFPASSTTNTLLQSLLFL